MVATSSDYTVDYIDSFADLESYSSISPEAVQTVVDTCTMIQCTIIFGIVIGVAYVTYKFLRIFI